MKAELIVGVTLFNKMLSEGFCGSLAMGVAHCTRAGMPQLLRITGEYCWPSHSKTVCNGS